MEASAENMQHVRGLLAASMSPDNAARQAAEATITGVETQAGFSQVLLALVQQLSTATATPEDRAIRQSCALLFKNLVKRRWVPEGDYDDLAPVPEADRDAVKALVVNLLCRTPPDVQKQLAEAVSIVSSHDFPKKWPGLLPQLVQQAASPDPLTVRGAMLTANSIMKRFRYLSMKNEDSSLDDLIVCLGGFQEVLLHVFRSNWAAVEAAAASPEALRPLLETQRLMCRIFYSLNWQDLPEYFEDNMPPWMDTFAAILQYAHPSLVDAAEDSEAGPVERLQAAVVENVNLYVEKYEEEFQPHMAVFTGCIWRMLLEVGPQPKMDALAIQGLRFLTCVAGKKMHMGLFSDAVLQELVQRIVVKNLTATEADEELFEDNPPDYIRKDMEGSDMDTRRRGAVELVRALLRFFPEQVSALCEGHMASLLEQYTASGGSDWRLKDTALHLLLASAALNAGCTELNPRVQMQAIFSSHVLPEVQDADVNARSLVRADALKLLTLFRTHLPAPFVIGLLPAVISHLKSSHVVVQTYAAICIERWLSVKDNGQQRVTQAHLQPHLDSCFTELFAVLENPDLSENDYVMKCIMRLLALVGGGVAPLVSLLMGKLTGVFARVAKNPVNPHYNHYLFECYALLIRACCSPGGGGVPEAAAANSACDAFEAALFPPFQEVLAQDISEFTPYVFQLLAQLLAFRPGRGLSEPYRQLFPPLLSPMLWERRGNVPALSQLLCSYVQRDVAFVCCSLQGVLGVYQKLLSSRANEPHALRLITTLLVLAPREQMQPFLGTCMQLLLTRLQDAARSDVAKSGLLGDRVVEDPGCKNPAFVRGLLVLLCKYATVHGGGAACDLLDAVQPGLFAQISCNVFAKHARQLCAAPKDAAETHRLIGGCAHLLCDPDSPLLLSAAAPGVGGAWGQLLGVAVGCVTALGSRETAAGAAYQEEEPPESREFDSAYSRLIYGAVPGEPLCEQDRRAPAYLVTQLAAVCSAQQTAAGLQPQLALLSADARAALTALGRANGVRI